MVTKAAEPREDRTGGGVLLMALAVGFFTLIDTSAKWLALLGLAPFQIVFARYAGHFLIAIGFYGVKEGLGSLRSNAPKRQLLRSLFLLCSTICNFFALRYLPITITTTIFFAGPILVTLLAIPVLGENVGIRRIIAVCTGFFGVLIVMQPWGAEFHPAMFFSLGALFFSSGYFIMTRLLAGIESNATAQIWSSGVATLVIAPFGLAHWIWPDSLFGYFVLAAIGTFGALGHIAANIAHRYADASILAPVVYIQLLLAALVGIFVFDTWPTFWTLGGGLIIIASGIYIWHRERQKGKSPRSPDPRRIV